MFLHVVNTLAAIISGFLGGLVLLHGFIVLPIIIRYRGKPSESMPPDVYAKYLHHASRYVGYFLLFLIPAGITLLTQ